MTTNDTPSPLRPPRAHVIAIALLAFSGLLAALLTPSDARVAIHWSLSGEADAFAGRWVALMIAPALLLLLSLALTLLPRGENADSASSQYWTSPRGIVWLGGLALLVILQMVMIAAAFGVDTSRIHLMPAIVGLVLIAVGLRMPTMKPNRWIGIRTPWTLRNPTVWARTHRLGAKIFVAAGVVIILLPLFGVRPRDVGSAILGILFAAAIISAAYSWWIRDP